MKKLLCGNCFGEIPKPAKIDLSDLDYTPMTHGVPDKIEPGYVRKSRRKSDKPTWVGVTGLTLAAMLAGFILGVGL